MAQRFQTELYAYLYLNLKNIKIFFNFHYILDKYSKNIVIFSAMYDDNLFNCTTKLNSLSNAKNFEF
jgi:hypothetical protein